MKTLLTLLLSTYFLSAADIHWQNSYQAGLTLAKAENKPIIVMLSASYCKVCKKMKKTVFTDEKIINRQNKHYISIMLDIKKDTLPSHLKSLGTPTFYYLSPEGKVLDTKVGGSNVFGWNKYLNHIAP